MQVRPQSQHRQDEIDLPRGRARVAGQQPQHGDERNVREALRAQLQAPRREEQRADADPERGAWRRAQRAGGEQRERKPADQGGDVTERDDLQPSERIQAVERELCEPLLIDPARAVRHDGQRLVRRQPVLPHLPAAGESQPAVARELERRQPRQREGVHADERDEVGLLRDEREETGPARGRASADGTLEDSHSVKEPAARGFLRA